MTASEKKKKAWFDEEKKIILKKKRKEKTLDGVRQGRLRRLGSERRAGQDRTGLKRSESVSKTGVTTAEGG